MLNKKIILSYLLILLNSISYSLNTYQIKYSKQAIYFLSKNNYKLYYYYKYKLKNTSIYSYLQYREIIKNPSIFQQSTIDKYFNKNNNIYWQNKLSNNLARYYAKKHNWKLFNKYYKNGSVNNSCSCWKMQMDYELGKKNKALNEYGKFWQNLIYIPYECNKMQKYWDNYNNKPKIYILKKVYNLAFANKFNDSLWLLNNYIKNNKHHFDYIKRWQETINNLHKLDSFINIFHNFNYFDKVIISISKYLIKKDVQSYAKVWCSLKNKKYLTNIVKKNCISNIVIAFAKSKSPLIKKLLYKVNKKYFNIIAWEWLLRINLYNNNFINYIKIYNQLPVKLKESKAWRYWLGYSFNYLGKKQKAKNIFIKLIQEPLNYYSFLASDMINKPYNFGKNIFILKNNKINDSKFQLLIEQSINLYKIGEYKDSINIWKWIVRNMLKDNDITKIKQLINVAKKNHMYYAVIFNISVIHKYNNIKMLFPKAFISIINKEIKTFNINKYLILSIMRKESLFNINAISSSGANGLMQITWKTAEFINNKYKLNLNYNKNKLMLNKIIIPKNNIKLGIANLYFLINSFNKDTILSIAAYNAGFGNVLKWLNKNKIPVNIWIENIPFNETRQYIQSILVYMIVYNNVIFKSKPIHINNFLLSNISINNICKL